MRINSIPNYNYKNTNPSFGKVKNIEFRQDFNPYENNDHLNILNTFAASKAIKKCCKENDVNISFSLTDIDVYKQMTEGKNYSEYEIEKYYKKEKGKHIYVTTLNITDANDKEKNYLYIMDDCEDKKLNAINFMKKITNLRPDFYKQDGQNKYITLPYLTGKMIEMIKSW